MGSWSIAIDTPPNVVSIGPYYNGKRHLKQMQALKRIALSHFIDRTNKPIECYTSKLIKHVDQMKASYKYLDRTAWHDNDDKFIEMMMLDGCFILEFLDIADKFPYYYSDPMFSCHVFVLNYDLVMQDLFMENNQLPYMVLATLWSIGFPDNEKHEGRGFLSKMMSVIKYPDPCFDQVLHYVKGAMEQYALEGKRRICCASELYQSGARFVQAPFSDTEFISENGILKLPSTSKLRSLL
ncbi:UPF0481 protein At3g47200-like [Papaver somniferum]|uniref:UPF0481 protein At3g47200-like n=1 Tax=Papaver somniferum TaxID=3469 RepID=UPI000E701FD0|nr:UPF0481 protein At3g47200-like [Papaver somniferum]